MKTERDRNLNADTASTAADSNRAEEVQKAVFLAEDSGLWYLGDLEHGNIYVTHTPSDTLYDENGNAIDPSEIKKGDFLQVEGDGIMLNSYPGQYPGISRRRMQKNSMRNFPRFCRKRIHRKFRF